MKNSQGVNSNNCSNNSHNNNCNCKTKINCPVNGMCYLINVSYQATIFPKENVKDKKNYIGISSVRWKLGYNNRIYSFSLERLRNQTALSKHFWKKKNMDLTPKIQWKILKRSTTLSCFYGRCNLYLKEKIHTMLC